MNNSKTELKHVVSTEQKKKKKQMNTMDIILIIVGISLFTFTVAMIWVFLRYGAVPDTLVTCVFACLGGECGVMGWIKTTKDRNKERKWEQEDKQEAKQAAREPEEAVDEPPRNDL